MVTGEGAHEVAVVNNDIITETELDRELDTIKMQLRQQNINMPPDETLRKQVLERLVINQIQLQLADANGIRVDDETLNNTLSNIVAQNNLSLSGFRDALEKEGLDFAQFRENIRKEIIMRRISQRNDPHYQLTRTTKIWKGLWRIVK